MRTRSSLILISALAIAPLLAHGQTQTYRWHDADGKLHYSDVPPVKPADVKKIKPPPPPVGGDAAIRQLAEREMAFKKRQLDAAASVSTAEKAQAEAEERRKNCEQSRSQLRMLESGVRISSINERGERFFLGEAEHSAQMAEARNAVNQWCQ